MTVTASTITIDMTDPIFDEAVTAAVERAKSEGQLVALSFQGLTAGPYNYRYTFTAYTVD